MKEEEANETRIPATNEQQSSAQVSDTPTGRVEPMPDRNVQAPEFIHVMGKETKDEADPIKAVKPPLKKD